MGSQTGCTACDNGSGCGAGVFAKLLRRKSVTFELERGGLDAGVGQMITLAFPEQVYLKMVLAYYGWPLLAAIGGASAGFGLGTGFQFGSLALDLATLAGGLLAGTFALRLLRRREAADTLMSAMQVVSCQTSATPDLCGVAVKENEENLV
jgi:positive regulator of sigma E activity